MFCLIIWYFKSCENEFNAKKPSFFVWFFYLIKKKRGLVKAILQKMNPDSNWNGVILCDVCKIRRSFNITLQQYCVLFQTYATLIKVMVLNIIDYGCVRACVRVLKWQNTKCCFFYLLNITLIWKKMLIYSEISFYVRKNFF